MHDSQSYPLLAGQSKITFSSKHQGLLPNTSLSNSLNLDATSLVMEEGKGREREELSISS